MWARDISRGHVFQFQKKYGNFYLALEGKASSRLALPESATIG
jgi:hypothetical protein